MATLTNTPFKEGGMKYTYTVIFEPAEEGGYLALVPALAATTQGETREEAREMVKGLIQGRLEALLKMGQPIPKETRRTKGGEPVTVTLTVAVAYELKASFTHA
jgi:predicted RNase H-like HicB family nuclease